MKNPNKVAVTFHLITAIADYTSNSDLQVSIMGVEKKPISDAEHQRIENERLRHSCFAFCRRNHDAICFPRLRKSSKLCKELFSTFYC